MELVRIDRTTGLVWQNQSWGDQVQVQDKKQLLVL